ncbi:hypothetical protein [Zavarzinia compransoris]|uniref:Uncharacterized protein n=1 Tax=Zavarzinia compransoris TaxID=1264899 RepID=A0A317E549_9PROT|nr:hypothetical protein [Zavarzinia compransoris]PWR22258.1 hypothetical protein DKG75_09875 [Zavarzinia compransoris]TDP46982.1 hypothetical protein DES42_103150 [Zavarzinia compransoris]
MLSLLPVLALRAEAALFDNLAARVLWAVLGTGLGLWQGPVAMIAMTAGLIATSALLCALGRLPQAPRIARAPAAAIGFARPQGV